MAFYKPDTNIFRHYCECGYRNLGTAPLMVCPCCGKGHIRVRPVVDQEPDTEPEMDYRTCGLCSCRIFAFERYCARCAGLMNKE